MAVVYTTDTGRGSLSLRQKRLGAAAGLSPQRKACASAHSDLFSGSGDVARPGKLAAGQRPRHLCAASAARTGKSTLNGRGGTAARGREARLRLVGKPEKLCADLLKKMGLKLPTRPKIIQNVVEKNGKI